MPETRYKTQSTASGSLGQEALYCDLQNQYAMFFAGMDSHLISPSISATQRYQILAVTSED